MIDGLGMIYPLFRIGSRHVVGSLLRCCSHTQPHCTSVPLLQISRPSSAVHHRQTYLLAQDTVSLRSSCTVILSLQEPLVHSQMQCVTCAGCLSDSGRLLPPLAGQVNGAKEGTCARLLVPPGPLSFRILRGPAANIIGLIDDPPAARATLEQRFSRWAP